MAKTANKQVQRPKHVPLRSCISCREFKLTISDEDRVGLDAFIATLPQDEPVQTVEKVQVGRKTAKRE
jgi:hypothetical protein